MERVKVDVTPSEMEEFETCLSKFYDDIKEKCPKFRILGMFAGVPSKDGPYGCMVFQGPDIQYDVLAQITSEMGTWMKKFGVQ